MINLTNVLGKLLHRPLLKFFAGFDLELTTPDGHIFHLNESSETEPIHIKIYEWSVFWDLLMGFDLGFAHAYIESKWDCSDLTRLFHILSVSQETHGVGALGRFTPRKIKAQIEQRIRGSNNKFWAKRNIRNHYDLSNHFFEGFLDPTMTYSSALFNGTELELEQGQKRKVAKLLENSTLAPTDHILDIGCGWGYLITEAASKYGCKATGVTLSVNQFQYCQNLIQQMGLEDKVDLILGDYRSLKGTYDHIFSVEMIEAVGHSGLDTFFKHCSDLLSDTGSLQLQVINIPHNRYDQYRKNCDFIQKYIFPGGLLPSLNRLENASEKNSFVIDKAMSIGQDYALTLEKWKSNLESNSLDMVSAGFSTKLLRQFNYYFSYCSGAFASNHIDNHQISMRRR